MKETLCAEDMDKPDTPYFSFLNASLHLTDKILKAQLAFEVGEECFVNRSGCSSSTSTPGT